jgi:hypothetical protein
LGYGCQKEIQEETSYANSQSVGENHKGFRAQEDRAQKEHSQEERSEKEHAQSQVPEARRDFAKYSQDNAGTPEAPPNVFGQRKSKNA